MLVLAEMIELIFFIAASMGLCFGFVLKTVDNSGMFSLSLSRAYTESRSFLLLTPPHQRGGWGCTRSWEGTQLGQLTPADQRDIPDHMASCSAHKSGEEEGKGSHLE